MPCSSTGSASGSSIEMCCTVVTTANLQNSQEPPTSEQGHNYQVIISASRNIASNTQQEVIDQVVRELADVFPQTGQAVLLHARLVTEHRAVFSVRPGADSLPAVAAVTDSERAARGRLDADRLAFHNGRRRPQRFPGRPKCAGPARATGNRPPARSTGRPPRATVYGSGKADKRHHGGLLSRPKSVTARRYCRGHDHPSCGA